MKKNLMLLLLAVSMLAVLLVVVESRSADDPYCSQEIAQAVIYVPFQGTECDFIDEIVRYCDLMDSDIIYVSVKGAGDLTLDCNVFRAMVYEANKPLKGTEI